MASGPYDWTFEGFDLGMTQGPPTMRVVNAGEEIRGDQFGESIVGKVNQGGALFLLMTLMEANRDQVKKVSWPLGEASGVLDTQGDYGVGCIQGKSPKKLVATGRGCASPYRYTFENAMVAPNINIDIPLGATLKIAPIAFLIIPENVNGAWRFFTETASAPA